MSEETRAAIVATAPSSFPSASSAAQGATTGRGRVFRVHRDVGQAVSVSTPDWVRRNIQRFPGW